MRNSSSGLIKFLMIVSVAGFVVLASVLTAVFADAFYKNLDRFTSDVEISYSKNAKIEAQDKIEKIIDFIRIYEKTLKKVAKERIKDNVNFAIDMIDTIYKENRDFPDNYIIDRINARLRDIRFFNNKTGYFFIYDLHGNCKLLPTNPSFEGTNQINLQGSNKEYIVRKAIEVVSSKQEGFLSWFWYKIGGKTMKKKIGFVKLYKPLNIFVGTARYEEDILESIKVDIVSYLKSLDKNEYGDIFAYDFSGNSMLESNKYIKINRWNDASSGYHLVRYAISGAKINPDGFFLRYNLKDNIDKFSYIKLVPEFNWILGANVKSIKNIYKKEKNRLEINLNEIMKNSILISLFVLAVFVSIFLAISFKIQNIYKRLEETVNARTAELLERKNIFKKLFDSAADGIALSVNRKIYECNDRLLKIFEAKDRDEFLKLETRDYFPSKQENGMNSMRFLENNLEIARRDDFVEFDMNAKTLKGRKIWLNIVVTKIILQNSKVGYFVFRDITDKKRIERDLKIQRQKLEFRAKHDSLTSLPNRIFLMDRLSQKLKRAKRKKRCLVVAFLDVDNFKMVNDAFGHDLGDLLLMEIASVLRDLIRDTDIVSRVSGDEFVVVIDDLAKADDSLVIIQKIVDRFQEPFYIKNHPFNITFSIGVSAYPNDTLDEQNLLKYADMAMYRAKNGGKNRFIYYDESMNTNVLSHIELEGEIRKGIKNDEFLLHYQPQFDVKTGEIVGFEALVRWQHSKLGLKYPDYFIHIAENSNLMIPLGEIISKKAMEQISSWYKAGLNPGTMSINFTSKQLESDGFFDKLGKMLEETGCKPQWIEAELVERYVMRDTEKTTNLLQCFKDIGMQVAIDDFGTGYSSLSYLKYLEISKLKIDKAFIDELENDKKDKAIAKSIIDLSIGLDLEVLAEGVETRGQYEILKELGCQIIQGYYFSKPVTCDEAQSLLIKKAEGIRQQQV